MRPAIVSLILLYKQMILDTRSKVRKEILENVVTDLEQVLKDAQ